MTDLMLEREQERALAGRTASRALLLLDAWLESMRGPDGYGGPVAHWWNHCLLFTAAGLDWRYEGIILGYLTIYRRTGERRWLDRARRAGDDLLRGQLASGNFRSSNFELNPFPAGTPHEAACDIGLLHLAAAMRDRGDVRWRSYAQAAERNLRGFLLDVLWHPKERLFWNSPDDATFVPNKAATVVEALFAWADLSGEHGVIDRYAIPTLDAMLECQVRAAGQRLDGAIDQGRQGRRGSGRFFPFYIARCIPALVAGTRHTGDARYRVAAQAAMSFIQREQLADGSFPQVLYSNGRVNRYPQWIAGTGDLLRAMDIMRAEGMPVQPEPTLRRLLHGQLPSGGIRTAHGFVSQSSQRPPRAADFHDILPVCGWVDKAFRYLSQYAPATLDDATDLPQPYELECVMAGEPLHFYEDKLRIGAWHGARPRYLWRKGRPLADAHSDMGEHL